MDIDGVGPIGLEGPSDARVTVESFDATGDPKANVTQDPERGRGANEVEFLLVGKRTGDLETIGDESEVDVGYVCVSSDARIHVEATVYFRDISGDKHLLTSVPILGMAPKVSSEFPMQNSQNPTPGHDITSTGLAIVHVSTTSSVGERRLLKGGQKAMVEIRPRSGLSGILIGEPIKIEVAPGEQISKFLHELAAGIPDFRGKVTVTSDLPIVVLPLVQEGLILTSQQVD